MDTSNPVLSGLIRKRQEIANDLDAAQLQVRHIVMDLDAVDATIRLFAPDIDLAEVRVRPSPRRHGAKQGDMSRVIQSVLMEAGETLSHREITLRVMNARGLSAADRPLYRTMRDRVGASLRGMRERGRLVSGEGKGSGVRWGLKDT